MKKIIIAGIFAALAIFTGCQKEDTSHYNEIQVSKSYVSLPVAGGTSTITLKATDAWAVKVKDKDKDVAWASWLTVSPLSGTAGEVTLTFSAEANEGKNADVVIECAGKAQHVNVIQGVAVVSEKTCKEVNGSESPEGKTYRVTGVCTKIAEFATYGNWYINDGTLEGDGLYIYGTKYNGQTKQAAITKLGIEVGDVITIEGPKTIYNGTVELVDVDVVKVVKSLCKVCTEVVEGEKEGGEVAVKVLAKGGNLNITPKADWIKIARTDIIKKQGKDPMDTTVVFLAIEPNEAGAREGQVEFTSGTSTVSATVKQAGAIAEVSIAEFLEAPVGAAQYKISGIITSVAKAEYGNVYIKDYSGEVYVYGIGAKGDFEKLGLKAGDIVTLIGTRAEHSGSPQMGGGQYVSHKPVTTMTCAEAIALADDDKNDPKNYVMVTGIVTDGSSIEGHKFDLATYGNFELVDASGSAYVYGVSTGWNGETKKFGTLEVKEGDELTIIAYKTSYKGTDELVGMYVSHTPKN